MLIRGVVDDQLGDDPQIAAMCFSHEVLEIRHPSIGRIDVLVIGDVIAVVAQRRGIEGQQPQRGNTEILQIIELSAQSLEIAAPIVIGVEERLDVKLIDDRVLVPHRLDEVGARQCAAYGQRRNNVVGWGHAASAVRRRKIIAGLASGSRWRRWRAPRQVTTRRVNASSSENSASAATPNSASGNSTSLSCSA